MLCVEVQKRVAKYCYAKGGLTVKIIDNRYLPENQGSCYQATSQYPNKASDKTFLVFHQLVPLFTINRRGTGGAGDREKGGRRCTGGGRRGGR